MADKKFTDLDPITNAELDGDDVVAVTDISADQSKKLKVSEIDERYAAKDDLDAHVADLNNPHVVTKTAIGLSNVDNTSDADKPVSSATQTALDLKADALDLSNHEADLANPHAVTKSQVGLGNVDDTSDLGKPVSTAQQTALDLKVDDTQIDTDVTLSADSDTRVASQKATKAFVEASIAGIDAGNLPKLEDNLCLNPVGAADASTWEAFEDVGGFVDGTGGSPTATLTTTMAVTFRGTPTSLYFNLSGATATNAVGVKNEYTVKEADRGFNMQVSLDLRTENFGGIGSKIYSGVYDIANSVLVTPIKEITIDPDFKAEDFYHSIFKIEGNATSLRTVIYSIDPDIGPSIRVYTSNVLYKVLRHLEDFKEEEDVFTFWGAKSSGVNAGTFTGATDVVREISDSTTRVFASLSSNQVTLKPGGYYGRIRSPAFRVNNHQAWLYNVTAAADVPDMTGTSGYTISSGANVLDDSMIEGYFELSVESIIEVRHRCGTTRSGDGLGNSVNLGRDEKYLLGSFRKVW